MGDVRTICLVGHSGAGKTALAEALLRVNGGGDEVQLDASPEAKARGSSVDLNVAGLELDGSALTLLDAPGFNEFIEETYKGLHAAETAILVINAEKGVEVQTETAWDLIQRYERPAIVLVHKLDMENAQFEEVLSQLQEQLEGPFAPIQWPIFAGGEFAGVVDLIEGQALYFDGRVEGIPAELASAGDSGRDALLEGLAEVDDELMERFLEDEEISAEDIRTALKMGIAQRSVVPVLATSIRKERSLKLFTRFVQESTPAFAGPEEDGNQGESAGLVFNATSDQYLGAMAFLKVYGGSLSEGTEVVNLRTGTKVRIRELLRPFGDKPGKISGAGPGEVVVLTKIDDFALGDTLSASPDRAPLSLGDLPGPVYPRAVAPLTEGDEEKMSTALRELARTKATLSLRRDEVTKQTILTGMGDTQLSMLVERLKNRFGTAVTLSRPLVPYKETITQATQAEYKHKKQTGGRGQYGEVHLRIEPMERGQGFEFVDEIKGGVIPNQFIPAVEKGVVESMQEGVFGYPITDVRVAVFFGSYHSVDSSEIAFKIAAAHAFKQAVDNDSPVLIEPVMKLTIDSPREFTGDIMSNLSGKRGRILGMKPEEGGLEHIEAEVPLAEVQDYALELKSITQGRARFQLEFDHYQPVSSQKLAEELLKREGRVSAES